MGDYQYNFTTAFIDFASKFGWTTDLKSASKDLIRKRLEVQITQYKNFCFSFFYRVLRTGDGSWTDKMNETSPFNDQEINSNERIEDTINKELVWGWGDEAMTEKEKASVNRSARV